MPAVTPKPKFMARLTVGAKALTNEAEHLGRRVRIVAGKHRGAVGTILAAYTAELLRPGLHEKGCRDVFYRIELPDTILEGVVWTEFLRIEGATNARVQARS